MKILMIDNYDSFTFNLFQYFGILGAEVLVFRNDEISIKEISKKKFDKIVISPGPGRPEDSGISIEIIEKFKEKVPILGVCLGHQVIGYVFGGKIKNAKRIMHGKISKVLHYNNSEIFRDIPNPFIATRYHSLAIKEENFPTVLEITARAEDSEIMGVQHKNLPIFGIQFHPESIMTKYGMKILQNFLCVK